MKWWRIVVAVDGTAAAEPIDLGHVVRIGPSATAKVCLLEAATRGEAEAQAIAMGVPKEPKNNQGFTAEARMARGARRGLPGSAEREELEKAERATATEKQRKRRKADRQRRSRQADFVAKLKAEAVAKLKRRHQ